MTTDTGQTDTGKPDVTSADITRTTRSPEEVGRLIEGWLQGHQPGARVTEVAVPSAGMSSETILFDATWPEGDGETNASLVARIEPPAEAVPVFPTYDLDVQHRAMALVGRHSDAPVPNVRWHEPDRNVLGGAFFVMDRVHGFVPPDVLPYTMDGPILTMSGGERRRLQDGTVDVLAQIHSVPISDDTAFLHHRALADHDPGLITPRDSDDALHRHVAHWRAYHHWAAAGRTIPVLDDAWRWLESHWPAAAGRREPVVAWGDSRIGNVMYDDQQNPVAVLDWEMAAIAPRETDLAWMGFIHTFFQDITVELELPGLPDMLRLDDLAERYATVSGVEPVDLDWFEVWAAYRHGIVMLRVNDRRIHFGEAAPSDDPDEPVMHRERLRSLISG